jgi:hypothetical protein
VIALRCQAAVWRSCRRGWVLVAVGSPPSWLLFWAHCARSAPASLGLDLIVNVCFLLSDTAWRAGSMGRSATGHLCENRSRATGRITSWGMAFSFAGRRRYLTLPARTRDQALREMAVVMEEVRLGKWMPPAPRRSVHVRGPMASFDKFAGAWVARQKAEVVDCELACRAPARPTCSGVLSIYLRISPGC